jgi:hypothetical protein
VGRQLTVAFACVLLLAAAVGGVALDGLRRVQGQADPLASKWLQGLGLVAGVRTAVLVTREFEIRHSRTSHRSCHAEYEAKIAAAQSARAGEQRRGFAVVASEVRSLPQRSVDAGTTMAEIVASIQRATDIVGEISTASAEQSTGVAQVGEAVSKMDRGTQQNAALLEQRAAAVDALSRQAEVLVQAVGVLRTGRQGGAASTAHSRFCTCSRICSISSFSSTDARDTSSPADLEPSVLASRLNSCIRKSSRLPT